MKGYKATRNMKCISLTYEVGKTYSINNLKICYHGFHFCQKMENVLNYYDHSEDFVLLEVEALGEVINEKDKSITDKIKILRVVPVEEYTFTIYKYEYDSCGNKISETHPDGSFRKWEYDSRGNMISTTNNFMVKTESYGDTWKYEYDSRGNKISMTNSIGKGYKREYDSYGNKISEIHPDGSNWKWEYDSYGNKISETNPKGHGWKITIE